MPVKQQLPAILFGLALASMAWSHAAHSVLSFLAAISFLISRPRDLIDRAPQYSKYVIGLVALIAIGFMLAPDKATAHTDVKGLWPLAHLFLAAAAINSRNAKYFINTFLGIAGLAAFYSALQYFSIVPRSDFSHQGGSFITTSRIWAFCVCMTTLAAISFSEFLNRQTARKILPAAICLFALFALWTNQERANFLLALFCLALIPMLKQDYAFRKKLIILGALPLIFYISVKFGGIKMASLANIIGDPQHTVHPIRIAHWQVAFDSFMSAPWFGHGLGSYPHLVAAHAEHGEYLKPFINTGHIWCHNMPLQLLATTGIFGTSIAAYVAYKITAPFVRALKTNNQAATIGLCACLIHFGASVTDTPSLQSVRLAAFTILVGFAYGSQQRD